MTVKDAKTPRLSEVIETVGHNKIAINFVWTLLAGLRDVHAVRVRDGGDRLARAKNAAHTMSMDFMIYPIGIWVLTAATHCRSAASAL